MIMFWLSWGIDALLTMVALYFFFVGLADGSVSGFNIHLWMLILGSLMGVLFGSFWLKNHGHANLAKVLAIFPALPSIGFGLIMLIALMSGARWN